MSVKIGLGNRGHGNSVAWGFGQVFFILLRI